MKRRSRSERPRPAAAPSAGRRGRPGSPRARLFVALDPPPGTRDEMAAWRDALVAGRDDLRAVPPASLHVTLAFLGYLPERSIPAVAAAVEVGARGASAPRLVPAGLRAVPPRGPRLFALDLTDDGGACAALQRAVAGALACARLHEPERRPFWPHITLARVKRGRRAEPLGEPASLPGALDCREVVLYRSHLGREGARYEALARFGLG